MLRPFERVTPGDAISATEFNRAMREVERHARFAAAAPLTLTSDQNGMRLGVRERPMIWARITGHLTNGYDEYSATDGSDDPTRYSGVEQTDDHQSNTAYDLLGGLQFFTNDLYLKEVNGRIDVPDNSIVRAYHSENGPYYTFLFETPFEDYGGVGNGDVEIVRITNFFVKDSAGQTGCNGLPSGLCYYPGLIQSLSCAGPTDGRPVWVVFWYTQAPIPPLGGVAGRPYTVVKCDGSAAHMAKYMGFSYAPNNGGTPEHPNNGEPRPVYLSTEAANMWEVSCPGTDPQGTLYG